MDINPLAGAILGSLQQQHLLEVEKTRQLRRSSVLDKNVAAADEQLEHEVENSDQLAPIHDEAHQQEQPSSRRHPHQNPDENEEPKHIDVRG
jgi:hypothetical protein